MLLLLLLCCSECMGGGVIQCTEEKCDATCSVYGDPHYITFDGCMYEFMVSILLCRIAL